MDAEINFGHDAECSYLLTRAAELIADVSLIGRAQETAQMLMEHVCREGLDFSDGGLYYLSDCDTGKVDRSKIWWVQAEGITACYNCYQITGDETYLDYAITIWRYIKAQIVNTETGDWNTIGENSIGDGTLRVVFTNEEKAGKGKCPYHNSRACFEMIKRVNTQYPDPGKIQLENEEE